MKKLAEFEAEKRAHLNQEEQKFYEQKPKLLKKFKESTIELKNKEIVRYENELKSIQIANDSQIEIKLKNEEEIYKKNWTEISKLK